MPSMVFSGLAIALIIADAGLAAFLGLIRDIGKYEKNISIGHLKVLNDNKLILDD